MPATIAAITAQPTHEFSFDHCTYKEFWTGEYPWSSSCHAQVLGLNGEVVREFHFSTNINRRGQTDADWCRAWAKNYIPAHATIDTVLDMWTRRGKTIEELMATLDKAVHAKKAAISSTSRPLFLYKGKALRNEWRKIHEHKRECKKFLANQGHLLQQFMTGGENYLPGSF
jgi:hypothetical protein